MFITFVNEYGKKGQSARPFVKEASEKAGAEAEAAGAAELDRWLTKTGL